MIASRLGWIVTGKTELEVMPHVNLTDQTTLTLMIDPLNECDNFIKKFWDTENIGIDEVKQEELDVNENVLNHFNQTIRFENNRYSVTLPWNEKKYLLPVHKQVTYSRLKSLLTRLTKTPELLKKYDDIFKEQLSKGILEEVPLDQMDPDHYIHFLPHHPVITPLKDTTKIRPVYHGSLMMKDDKTNLKECLHNGPLLLEELLGLLLRLRLHKIVLISDIEKAFLQVGIQMPDRDVTRTYWVKDISKPLTNTNLQTLRFARVPFGLNCSPFLLAATIKYHLQREDTPINRQILSNIYVDNVITGVEDIQTAKEFYTSAKRIFQQASMNLREWATNDPHIREYIPKWIKLNRLPYIYLELNGTVT